MNSIRPSACTLLALRLARLATARRRCRRRARSATTAPAATPSAVAPHELGEHGRPALSGARGDRLVVEVAAQVVGQQRRRWRSARPAPSSAPGRRCCRGRRAARARAGARVRAAAAQHGVGQAPRLRLDHGAHLVERRGGAAPAVGCAAAEQHVQQHAQRVDVGRGGDVAALQLLGRGVLQRERAAGAPASARSPAAGVRPRRRSSLAMPKSSSFTSPAAVTRMFDGLRSRCRISRLCACATAASTSRNSRTRAGRSSAVRVAVAVDRQAVDVLEHQIGLRVPRARRTPASSRRAMFGCASRARMLPSRAKRSAPPRAHQPGVQELDRDEAFEAAVGAARQPHAAHAALAELALERVGADASGRPCVARGSGSGGRRERHRGRSRRAGRAGASSSSASAGPRRAGLPGARRASAASQVQQLVQQRAQARPAGLVASGASGWGERLAASDRRTGSASKPDTRRCQRSAATGTGAPSASRAARCARSRPGTRRSRVPSGRRSSASGRPGQPRVDVPAVRPAPRARAAPRRRRRGTESAIAVFSVTCSASPPRRSAWRARTRSITIVRITFAA